MKKSSFSREWRNTLTGLAFIAPSFVGFLVFSIIPVVASLCLSFFKWDLLNPPEFIGIKNYVDMFTTDPLFWKVIWNTTKYALITTPGTMILALLLALLINQKIAGRTFFRFVYFLPVVTSAIAISCVWGWMYDGDFGLINSILYELFKIQPIAWLADEKLVIISVAVVGIWSGTGTNMLLYLAGLQGIPRHLYEAADIDGANTFRKFISVTLPMLTPTTFFVMVMTTIGSFQVFDFIYMMTNAGGPNNSSKTIVFYIYDNGFKFLNMGFASALAWALFIIIFSLTVVQLRLQNKWVEY